MSEHPADTADTPSGHPSPHAADLRGHPADTVSACPADTADSVSGPAAAAPAPRAPARTPGSWSTGTRNSSPSRTAKLTEGTTCPPTFGRAGDTVTHRPKTSRNSN
ncbi:hypothetical protein [Streptomyces sp. G1]|uniref:hypothetical protein n=1 Tax=Streptomyces sp. G1 TaxID=361572 RepID=UPI0020303874|nr:hypothetical protein [Streptomyces sp. G1]MCM1964898.1 hypothetical protein [Streptomyces sp. G1]